MTLGLDLNSSTTKHSLNIFRLSLITVSLSATVLNVSFTVPVSSPFLFLKGSHSVTSGYLLPMKVIQSEESPFCKAF